MDFKDLFFTINYFKQTLYISYHTVYHIS